MSRRHPSVTAALGGAVAIALLAGCAELQTVVDDTLGGSGGGGGVRTVAYECDDDQEFSARFSGDRDEVDVRTDDETYDLELADRDNGRRVYSESGDDDDDEVRLTLGDNGRRARLDIPDEDAYEQCYADMS